MAGVVGRVLAQAVPGAMEERLAATEASTADLVGAVDTMFVLFSAYLVFFMQAGFAMVSAPPLVLADSARGRSGGPSPASLAPGRPNPGPLPVPGPDATCPAAPARPGFPLHSGSRRRPGLPLRRYFSLTLSLPPLPRPAATPSPT